MNEMTELKEATAQYLEKAHHVFNRTFPMPLISLDLRGVVAGKANMSQWMVKYNLELYIRNKEDFINRTVPHELAHLITRTLYGHFAKPHGREWRSVMRKLGVKDIKRCHSYDIDGIKMKRSRPFVYTCGCQEHKLTKLIHIKILLGQKRYCVKCRNNLVYQRTEMVA